MLFVCLLPVVAWWLLLFDIDFEGTKMLFNGVHDHGVLQIVSAKKRHFVRILLYFLFKNNNKYSNDYKSSLFTGENH